MRPLLILNPNAGRLRAEGQLRLRLSGHPLLSAEGVRFPATGEDARVLARQGADEGWDPILAGGGDGTVNAVVNGLMELERTARPTFAVVPLGTANDFVRTLGVPEDPVAALELIKDGARQTLDLVRVEVNGEEVRFAANAVTGGFTAEAEEGLSNDVKDTWGPLAYLRTGIGALPDLSQFRTTIQIDEQEPRDMHLLSLVVANGRAAGGGIPVCPDALLDDGLLDVLLIPQTPAAALARVAASILQGSHWGSEYITATMARKLELTSEPPIWLSLDGELLRAERVSFQVEPRALTVVRGSLD